MGRPFNPLAKAVAALVDISEPNKSKEDENQKLIYFCIVIRSIAPADLTCDSESELLFFIISKVLSIILVILVSPTCIW